MVTCNNGRYRFRVMAYWKDGTPVRVSGSPAENTHRAAIALEARYIAYVGAHDPIRGGKKAVREAIEKEDLLSRAGASGSLVSLADAQPPTAQTAEKNKGVLFEDFEPSFMAVRRRKCKKIGSFMNVEKHMRCVKRWFGGMALRDIDAAQLLQFQNHLLTEVCPHFKKQPRPLAPVTVRHIMKVLRAFLRLAWERHVIREIPEFPRLEVSPSLVFSLDEAESHRLINACSGWIQTAIIVALDMGPRVGELLALQKADVQGEILRISRRFFAGKLDVPKSGRPRDVGMTEHARRAIEAYDNPYSNTWMFSNEKGKPLTYRRFRRALNAACEAAGLGGRNITPHVLRRTFASQLYAAGVPLKTVSVQLGHSSVAETETYLRLNLHSLHHAATVMDSIRKKRFAPEPRRNRTSLKEVHGKKSRSVATISAVSRRERAAA